MYSIMIIPLFVIEDANVGVFYALLGTCVVILIESVLDYIKNKTK